MSTKTTFKRVALVTVAALGFGVMSTVAPASAAVAMDTLTVTDGTGSVGDSVTATSATTTITYLPSATADSVTVVASLVSAPAGNTVFPRLSLAETVNAYVNPETATANDADILGTTYASYTNVAVAPGAAGASNTVSAKFNVWIGASATSGVVTAGTYVVRITPTAKPTAGTATFKDITITIAAATQSSSLSTAYINSGATAPTAASDIVAVVAANTAQTAIASRAANIHVTQVRASGTAANESITATITGPGTLGCATALTGAEGTSAGRSLTCKTDGAGVVYVNVYGDGTSGRSTVTITGVTSGHKFATKSILFSSTTIAKLTATAVNPVVSATGTSATDAVSVVATDADGNQIYSPTVYVISSATSVLSNAYSTTGCNWDSTDLVTYCDVTPVAAGTANITFTNRASATATTPLTRVDSNAVAIRVGSVSPATAKLSFDKTSYAPGEKATLTLTLLDAAGNAVAGSADNSTYANTWATGGITSDYAFYAGSDTLTATFARVSATTGLQTWTLYMPLQATELTVKAVPGTIFPAAYQAANTATTTTVTAKASVGNAAGVDAATDAANEATDAANAATDAALAAADAADAATAAAQDASDAVAALSASVSKLISSLRAQITSLTNLVIKIQKKVRA
jgi:trimeric autotransporter adhesin